MRGKERLKAVALARHEDRHALLLPCTDEAHPCLHPKVLAETRQHAPCGLVLAGRDLFH
jgi:hypothetical protein